MSQREVWWRDLLAEAKAGRLDPVVGRSDLIEKVLQVLSRRTKRNVVLTGAPGVGKTALAEGLAQILAANRVPPSLEGRGMLSLDLGFLLAGTSYRGDFEGRVSLFIKKLKTNAKAPIVFIDELHLLTRAGRSEGGLDAANLLKPVLARGDLLCLGASTAPEWERMIAEDPALGRRFTRLEVLEPTAASLLQILEALRPGLELHHGVSISDEALQAAIQLPLRPGYSSAFPDRAIDYLDEGCAWLQMQNFGFLASTGGQVPSEKHKVAKEREAPRALSEHSPTGTGGRFDLKARAQSYAYRGTRAEADREPANPQSLLLACHLKGMDTPSGGLAGVSSLGVREGETFTTQHTPKLKSSLVAREGERQT